MGILFFISSLILNSLSLVILGLYCSDVNGIIFDYARGINKYDTLFNSRCVLCASKKELRKEYYKSPQKRNYKKSTTTAIALGA